MAVRIKVSKGGAARVCVDQHASSGRNPVVALADLLQVLPKILEVVGLGQELLDDLLRSVRERVVLDLPAVGMRFELRLDAVTVRVEHDRIERQPDDRQELLGTSD